MNGTGEPDRIFGLDGDDVRSGLGGGDRLDGAGGAAQVQFATLDSGLILGPSDFIVY